jgi:hypothetical protein
LGSFVFIFGLPPNLPLALADFNPTISNYY